MFLSAVLTEEQKQNVNMFVDPVCKFFEVSACTRVCVCVHVCVHVCVLVCHLPSVHVEDQ